MRHGVKHKSDGNGLTSDDLTNSFVRADSDQQGTQKTLCAYQLNLSNTPINLPNEGPVHRDGAGLC